MSKDKEELFCQIQDEIDEKKGSVNIKNFEIKQINNIIKAKKNFGSQYKDNQKYNNEQIIFEDSISIQVNSLDDPNLVISNRKPDNSLNNNLPESSRDNMSCQSLTLHQQFQNTKSLTYNNDTFSQSKSSFCSKKPKKKSRSNVTFRYKDGSVFTPESKNTISCGSLRQSSSLGSKSTNNVCMNIISNSGFKNVEPIKWGNAIKINFEKFKKEMDLIGSSNQKTQRPDVFNRKNLNARYTERKRSKNIPVKVKEIFTTLQTENKLKMESDVVAIAKIPRSDANNQNRQAIELFNSINDINMTKNNIKDLQNVTKKSLNNIKDLDKMAQLKHLNQFFKENLTDTNELIDDNISLKTKMSFVKDNYHTKFKPKFELTNSKSKNSFFQQSKVSSNSTRKENEYHVGLTNNSHINNSKPDTKQIGSSDKLHIYKNQIISNNKIVKAANHINKPKLLINGTPQTHNSIKNSYDKLKNLIDLLKHEKSINDKLQEKFRNLKLLDNFDKNLVLTTRNSTFSSSDRKNSPSSGFNSQRNVDGHFKKCFTSTFTSNSKRILDQKEDLLSEKGIDSVNIIQNEYDKISFSNDTNSLHQFKDNESHFRSDVSMFSPDKVSDEKIGMMKEYFNKQSNTIVLYKQKAAKLKSELSQAIKSVHSKEYSNSKLLDNILAKKKKLLDLKSKFIHKKDIDKNRDIQTKDKTNLDQYFKKNNFESNIKLSDMFCSFEQKMREKLENHLFEEALLHSGKEERDLELESLKNKVFMLKQKIQEKQQSHNDSPVKSHIVNLKDKLFDTEQSPELNKSRGSYRSYYNTKANSSREYSQKKYNPKTDRKPNIYKMDLASTYLCQNDQKAKIQDDIESRKSFRKAAFKKPNKKLLIEPDISDSEINGLLS